MPHFVIASENSGSRIYKIGRVGLDTGTQDTGGPFTATGKTERYSPAGERGLVLFRRVVMRVWHTGAFSVTLKVWVDGVRTKLGGVDQTISFTEPAPAVSPAEAVLEGAIEADGTFVEVEFSVVSNSVAGVMLPETIEMHGIPIRASRSRTAETT